MKKPILVLLSIALLAPTISATDAPPSPSPSVNEYGIDPEASYPGDLVTDLLQAAEDEAVTVAQESFDEGFKQGRIDARDLWKPKYEEAVGRADLAWKTARASGLLALLGGIAVGFGAGLAACSVTR